MPEKKFDAEDENAGDHETTESSRINRANTLEDELIYDSSQRGSCYHCIRVLWCGCCEPNAHITTKYVKENRWEGCTKKADSMAFENIRDVRRQQNCCCLIASFLPCCFCIEDMGDLVLYGSDASEKKKNDSPGQQLQADRLGLEDEKWVLKRISNSFDTFEKITGHLQELHAGWRKLGRNLGRKIAQVKN